MAKTAISIEHSTFFKMVQLVNLTARPFERLYEKRYNIRLTEWRVLLALAARPGLTATDLTDMLAMDKMAISRAIRKLEELGRLVREPDRTDQRRSLLALSDAGWTLYGLIAPSARAREALLMLPLEGEDRAAFDRLLDRLVAHARSLPVDGEDLGAADADAGSAHDAGQGLLPAPPRST